MSETPGAEDGVSTLVARAIQDEMRTWDIPWRINSVDAADLGNTVITVLRDAGYLRTPGERDSLIKIRDVFTAVWLGDYAPDCFMAETALKSLGEIINAATGEHADDE